MNIFRKSIDAIFGRFKSTENKPEQRYTRMPLKTECILAPNYGHLKLDLVLPLTARLDRLYDWNNGDTPAPDDYLQWLCLLECLSDNRTYNDFDACWALTPIGVKRTLLRYYLYKKPPMSKFSWKLNIPIGNLSIYSNLHDHLIVVHPYVFFRKDVPFLFDTDIPPPGSGKPGAWNLDIDKALAIYLQRGLNDDTMFERAVSNEKPLNPVFENRNGFYYVRLPFFDRSEEPVPIEYTTEDVNRLETANGTQIVDMAAVRKMIELANRTTPTQREETDNANTNMQRHHEPWSQPYTKNKNTASPIDTKPELNDTDQAPPTTSSKKLPTTEIRPLAHLTPSITNWKFDSPGIDPTFIEARGKTDEKILTYKENSRNDPIAPSHIDNNVDIIPTKPPPLGTEQYRIGTGITQRIIGRGGMGLVYECWNEDLEQSRALKLLVPMCTIDPDEYNRYKTRFLREIKVQSNMHCTNIVQIHMYGEWEKYPYIEMEYVDGADINKIIQKYGKIDSVVALALTVQILTGLHYAHTKSYRIDNQTYTGIIHRDIKPNNAIVSVDGYLKLVDFGIALPIGMVTMSAQSGSLIGTVPYMSPEQINGNELDPRSDIYSVGTLLYEMVTGVSAYGRGANMQEVLNAILAGTYRSLDDYKIKMPKSIRHIVNQCMQLDPDDRFETASIMLSICLESLHELTREFPEAIVKNFVNQKKFKDATTSFDIPFRR
jgi:hypothetical protein